jgi:hypothetical protein
MHLRGNKICTTECMPHARQYSTSLPHLPPMLLQFGFLFYFVVLFFNGYLMYFLNFVCIMLLLCCVGYCLPFVLWIYPLAETFVIVNFPYHLSIINNIKTIKKRKGQVQIPCPPLSHFREYKDQVFPPKIAIEIHIYRPERWRGFSYAPRINLGGRR